MQGARVGKLVVSGKLPGQLLIEPAGTPPVLPHRLLQPGFGDRAAFLIGERLFGGQLSARNIDLALCALKFFYQCGDLRVICGKARLRLGDRLVNDA